MLFGNRIYLSGFTYSFTAGTASLVLAYQNDGLPLPVKLLQFTAIRKNNTAQLLWQTAAGFTTGNFVIEQGTDGIHFSSIGIVAAADGFAGNSYTFTTVAPNQLVFYRLKMIEKDGKFTYSPVAKLAANLKAYMLQVYPNPAGKQLQVSSSGFSGITKMYIADAAGRTVQQLTTPVESGQMQMLNIEALPAGVYYIVLWHRDGLSNCRFIKF